MVKILFVTVLLLSMLSGCSSNKKEKDNNPENINEKISLNIDKEKSLVLPSDSGIIKIDLINGKGSVKTEKKENQTIYIEFPSQGYKKVYAKLSSSDSLANIRFSQIFLPDGTMDGPFGRELEYQLSNDGIYKISVHENMMAGDPWAGIFSIDINLSN